MNFKIFLYNFFVTEFLRFSVATKFGNDSKISPFFSRNCFFLKGWVNEFFKRPRVLDIYREQKKLFKVFISCCIGFHVKRMLFLTMAKENFKIPPKKSLIDIRKSSWDCLNVFLKKYFEDFFFSINILKMLVFDHFLKLFSNRIESGSLFHLAASSATDTVDQKGVSLYEFDHLTYMYSFKFKYNFTLQSITDFRWKNFVFGRRDQYTFRPFCAVIAKTGFCSK